MIAKITFAELSKSMPFYEYNNCRTINGYTIHIKFNEDDEVVTYSDIKYGKDKNIFEYQKQLLLKFSQRLFLAIPDPFVVVRKYSGNWYVNNLLSHELVDFLEKESIKNEDTACLIVPKKAPQVKLFMESILKYNSFVDFSFVNHKVIITLTDHMDMFVSSHEKILPQVSELVRLPEFSCLSIELI